MRRDARAGLAAQFQDAMPKIQNGLRSINAVRMRLEMVARAAPEELHKKQMLNLIETVRNNMHETLALLIRLDTTAGANQKQATVIKKLKNDLAKEEAAIDAVVTLAMVNKSSPGTNGSSNGNASPSVNSSSSSSSSSSHKGSKASPSMSRGNVRQQERDREKQQMARELQQRGSGDSSSSRRSFKTNKASSEEGDYCYCCC